MATEDDDEYIIPLKDQRVFGAGIKRKGIAFIPAAPLETTLPANGRSISSAADRYLSIVLPKNEAQQKIDESGEYAAEELVNVVPTTCAVCNQQIASGDKVATDAHESSIAHQVCLEHSHPPSHLDRGHVGLRYMTGYGWDPDSHRGLGAREDGIRMPIKAKEKNNTTGLREQEHEDDVKVNKKKKPKSKTEDKITVRLNAKEVRKREGEAKKRAEKLRASFYGSSDVEKYLGSEESRSLDFSGFHRS